MTEVHTSFKHVKSNRVRTLQYQYRIHILCQILVPDIQDVVIGCPRPYLLMCTSSGLIDKDRVVLIRFIRYLAPKEKVKDRI